MNRTAPIALALVITTAWSSGCTSSHASREVGSGIYALTVRGDADACSPSRTTGAMGTVGIVAEGDVLNVAVPDGIVSEIARVSLARSDGFATEVDVAIEGCEGARLHRIWSVLETSPDRFEVSFAEEWIGITGCAAARASMPVAPETDCTAQQIFEYTLETACAAPCEVRLVGSEASCVCE